MLKLFTKRILRVALAICLCILLLPGCRVKEPNAKEIVKQLYEPRVKLADLDVHDIYNQILDIFKSKDKNKSKVKVNLEIPFSFIATSSVVQAKGGMAYGLASNEINQNGTVKIKADIELTNMGYIEGYNFIGAHYLYKIICDYQFNIGGSFAPMGFGLDGRLQCYLKFDESFDSLEIYYKLNDYDANWYEYSIGYLKEGLIAIHDLIKSKNQILNDNNDKSTNDEFNKFEKDMKEKILQYESKLIDKISDSAIVSNRNVRIDELNVDNAFEIKYRINYIDEDYITLFSGLIEENSILDQDAKKEAINSFEILMNQLKNKIVINGALYVVESNNSNLHDEGYSIIKTVLDFTDMDIDFSFGEIKFNASFSKGEIVEYCYIDFEVERIPDDVLKDALVVDQINLDEVISAYGNNL